MEREYKMPLDMFDIYNIIGNPPLNLTDTTLMEYFPTVTSDDIQRGFITRYFIRQSNHTTGYIYEISKADFDRLRLNSVYHAISMMWRISGPIDDVERTLPSGERIKPVTGVKTANKLALELAEEEMAGIKTRIHNLLQLYKS
jgi:hypothetical protein